MLPVALTVAGSDCSAGAGIQADLKTFTAHGVYGLTAVTCAVSETANVVEAVHPLPADFLGSQVALLLRSFPVAAVKTGMLFSRAHIEAFLAALGDHPAPVVVDPVMVASTGDALLQEDAVDAYRARLLPRAAVITPNLDEASVLLQERITREEELEPSARALRDRFGVPVLLKGGHLASSRAIDLLVDLENAVHRFESDFLPGAGTHGSGCTLSAALAANLALGHPLPEAASMAKEFITRAIAGAHRWDGPSGPIRALDQTGAGARPVGG